MTAKGQRPEPGVCYAAFPTVDYAEARSFEAAESLGQALGVSPGEAWAMLEDGTAADEIRSMRGLTVAEARRQLERRYRGP